MTLNKKCRGTPSELSVGFSRGREYSDLNKNSSKTVFCSFQLNCAPYEYLTWSSPACAHTRLDSSQIHPALVMSDPSIQKNPVSYSHSAVYAKPQTPSHPSGGANNALNIFPDSTCRSFPEVLQVPATVKTNSWTICRGAQNPPTFQNPFNESEPFELQPFELYEGKQSTVGLYKPFLCIQENKDQSCLVITNRTEHNQIASAASVILNNGRQPPKPSKSPDASLPRICTKPIRPLASTNSAAIGQFSPIKLLDEETKTNRKVSLSLSDMLSDEQNV